MTLNDKLAQLRALLQDIEEEAGDALTVAYDLIGGHIDKGTPAGRVVASDWRRLRIIEDHSRALQSCRSLGIGDQPPRSIMDMYGLTIHDDERGSIARALGAHPSEFCDRYVQGNEVVWEREIPQPLPLVPDPVEVPTFFQAARRRLTGDGHARPSLFSMEEVRAWNERAQVLSQAVRGEDT